MKIYQMEIVTLILKYKSEVEGIKFKISKMSKHRK
jgi:hypothetical protein